MREVRRFRLARRQLLLANVARREAMAALADAVSEEARSTELAQRSHELLQSYREQIEHQDGASLRSHATFAHSLGGIARQAEETRRDARDQAGWQAETLAAARIRASRLAERLESARKEKGAAQARRQYQPDSGLARKLQSHGCENRYAPPTLLPRKRP